MLLLQCEKRLPLTMQRLLSSKCYRSLAGQILTKQQSLRHVHKHERKHHPAIIAGLDHCISNVNANFHALSISEPVAMLVGDQI